MTTQTKDQVKRKRIIISKDIIHHANVKPNSLTNPDCLTIQ